MAFPPINREPTFSNLSLCVRVEKFVRVPEETLLLKSFTEKEFLQLSFLNFFSVEKAREKLKLEGS